MSIVEAVTSGDVEAVRGFLSAGEPAEQPLDEDNTLLTYAAWQGYTEIVVALLAAGAVPGDALGDCAYEGHVETIDALIAGGADVNRRGEFGSYALTNAAEAGKAVAVERLIAAGAALDVVDEEEGRSALSHAASSGHRDVVRALIAGGAPLEQRNRNGFTALLSACVRNDGTTIDMLLEAGADIRARTDERDGALELATDSDLLARLEGAGAVKDAYIDDAFRARFGRVETPPACLVPVDLEAVTKRVLAWLEANVEYHTTRPPPTDAALSELEQTLGCKLPSALVSLLKTADGDSVPWGQARLVPWGQARLVPWSSACCASTAAFSCCPGSIFTLGIFPRYLWGGVHQANARSSAASIFFAITLRPGSSAWRLPPRSLAHLQVGLGEHQAPRCAQDHIRQGASSSCSGRAPSGPTSPPAPR